MAQSVLDVDALYGPYHKRVYGFFRGRIHHDAEAEDLAQTTWEMVWKNRSRYEPTRAPAVAFVMYWANIVLLRYYQDRARYQEFQAELARIRQRFPDIDKGEEFSGIVAFPPPPPEEGTIDAEEEKRRLEVYERLARIFFKGSSPPHQLLTFGFRELLAQNPRDIVARCSDVPLRTLTEQFIAAYLRFSLLPAKRLSSHVEPLRRKMERTVKDVITDAKTIGLYERLRDAIVGDTTLRDYYTNPENPADNIYQWRWAVLRRLVKDILQQDPELLLLLREIWGKKPGSENT